MLKSIKKPYDFSELNKPSRVKPKYCTYKGYIQINPKCACSQQYSKILL